jgi:hypothetical protein
MKSGFTYRRLNTSDNVTVYITLHYDFCDDDDYDDDDLHTRL